MTDEIDVTYDLCIVGAGMFGSAAARHASANLSVKVCLIGPREPKDDKERKDRDIFGAHYDEGRIIRFLDEELPSQILVKHSVSRYRELEELSGIQFYYPVGYLSIGKRDSPHINKLKQTAYIAKLPVIDLSYNGIFNTRFPYINLKDDDYPLFDDTGAGHISPRNMVAAQIKVARDQGCDIIEDVVDEVRPLINGIHEIKTEKGKRIKAKRVLFCTGAFTNFKTFPMPELKIYISSETVALLRINQVEAERLSAMPSIVYCNPEENIGFYILPPIRYPDDEFYLKIGDLGLKKTGKNIDTLRKLKNWYLSEGDSQKRDEMSNFLIDMLPGLNVQEISSMTCAFCKNTSGLPYIDKISPTVTVAAVGNGGGAKISEEVGRIAAIFSLTGRWDSELPKSMFRIILNNE